MISILVNIIVIMILLAVLFWIMDLLGIWAKLPDILRKVIIAVAVLLVVIWLIALLKDGGSSRYLLFRI